MKGQEMFYNFRILINLDRIRYSDTVFEIQNQKCGLMFYFPILQMSDM